MNDTTVFDEAEKPLAYDKVIECACVGAIGMNVCKVHIFGFPHRGQFES